MDKVLTEALRLQKLGFAVHWLRPKSKIPLENGWASLPVMDAAQLKTSYRSGYNLGFRAGKWSVVDGREICVLDIDIRGGAGFADEAYAAAGSILGSALTPHVISGSIVGRHQYLGFSIGSSPDKAATTLRQSDVYTRPNGDICAKGELGAKPAWLVEILSTGKQVVLPPSVHPDTGQAYTWAESIYENQ